MYVQGLWRVHKEIRDSLLAFKEVMTWVGRQVLGETAVSVADVE